MTIPTERLREMRTIVVGMALSPEEVQVVATELLAARDALAALTKERDAARKASAHWLKRCHELGDEIDGLRAEVPVCVREWANAVVVDSLETEHLLNDESQHKAATWILRTRAALAATEGGQGGA
jgi:L-rhamnose isomerase